MINRELVILTAVGEYPALGRAAINIPGAQSVDLVFLDNEDKFLERFPPHRIPLAFFISYGAALGLSVATTALLSARPISFPPLILFGQGVDTMRLVMFKPNSILEASGEELESTLQTAFHYWAVLNAPMD